MNRFVCFPMSKLAAALLTATFASSSTHAAVYVTGSVSASTSNVPMQTYQSTAASGSLAIDLGRYMRIGVTHKQEFQESEGFKNTSEDEANPTYVEAYSRTQIVSNSLDLTLILYEGTVFLPYLTLGGIIKNYRFVTEEAGQAPKKNTGSSGPVPNVGIGVGLRLNKDFTLKFSYLASPGQVQLPGEEKSTFVWDRSTSIGLTYQL